MGAIYRNKRFYMFGSRLVRNLLKTVLIVIAVMLFWTTFLWVGFDMHLPGSSAVAADTADTVVCMEAEEAEEEAVWQNAGD